MKLLKNHYKNNQILIPIMLIAKVFQHLSALSVYTVKVLYYSSALECISPFVQRPKSEWNI